MAMASDQKQPDWLQLPLDLLEPIANRSRDAVTRHTVFRSVCRTWRSAVGQAPRLLLPAPLDSVNPRAGSEHALIFPLSRGWSVIVDARDASCRVFHLATGATAVLPKINAFRDRYGITTHVRYVHYTDDERERGIHCHWVPLGKIFTKQPSCGIFFTSYLDFSDSFRALHFPPSGTGTPAATAVSTDDDLMMIMMCHRWVAGQRGMVFCRPGDVAWTELPRCSSNIEDLVDFAFFQGKIYGLQRDGITKVYQATEFEFLHAIDVPHATLKCSSYVDLPFRDGLADFHYLNLVALPSKVLLVRTRVKSYEPEGFDVFELGPKSGDGKIIAWRKVTWDSIGGNYELFLDGYHTAFRQNTTTGSGTRIYSVLGQHRDPTVAAYCYHMKENRIECVYRPPADNYVEYSTKPSWFVP